MLFFPEMKAQHSVLQFRVLPSLSLQTFSFLQRRSRLRFRRRFFRTSRESVRRSRYIKSRNASSCNVHNRTSRLETNGKSKPLRIRHGNRHVSSVVTSVLSAFAALARIQSLVDVTTRFGNSLWIGERSGALFCRFVSVDIEWIHVKATSFRLLLFLNVYFRLLRFAIFLLVTHHKCLAGCSSKLTSASTC